jgi:hypothetical protein
MNPIGRIGSLLQSLNNKEKRLPSSLVPVSKFGQASKAISNATIGTNALLYGSDVLEEQLKKRGLMYDPQKDPRVILGYDVFGKPSTRTPKAGPQLNELKDSLNIPGPGQIAYLGGKEVRWDGAKWVRTNIEDIASDPFGTKAQALSVGSFQEITEPPVGQGSEETVLSTSTGTDDPSYLKNAFTKAFLARLLSQSNFSPQSTSSPYDQSFSSLLESQRELGRSIMS